MEPMPMPQGVPGGGLPQGAMAPPMGGMPAGLAAPPAHVGPHTIPQHNPGNILQAMQKIHAATQMITEAIPQIPMGSPFHQKIMKISMELTKELSSATDTLKSQPQVQALLQQLQAAKSQGQMGMLQTAAPSPNQPPAMPPPQQAA